jgi:1,4-dihydroxy-2-naphthoyl-CoA synthase
MRLLQSALSTTPEPRVEMVRAGVATSVSTLRTTSMRPRRRLLMACVSPLLPFMPKPVVQRVHGVAYGGSGVLRRGAR